jgi:diguanylate cyclase (GGDEF)-like protein
MAFRGFIQFRPAKIDMANFTKRELLLTGAIITLLGADLLQRRRLKKIATELIPYYSRLFLTATRVAQNVRSLLDVARILEVAVEEVVPGLEADQCVVRVKASEGEDAVMRCHPSEPDSATMSDFLLCCEAIHDGNLPHYARQGVAHYRNKGASSEAGMPLLGVPITYAGRSFGTLMVRSDDPARTWSEYEVQALLAVVWEAVSQAHLFAEKEQQSLTDGLTGCENRRSFDLRLERELRVAETGRPSSLVLVDVDHFKVVNDSYGHTTGDEVLRVLGTLLLETIPPDATAARYGGEEFALILPRCELEEAKALAERVRARVEGAKWPGVAGAVTASFGVATIPIHGSSSVAIIESVDRALYMAKKTGRNRVCTA